MSDSNLSCQRSVMGAGLVKDGTTFIATSTMGLLLFCWQTQPYLQFLSGMIQAVKTSLLIEGSWCLQGLVVRADSVRDRISGLSAVPSDGSVDLSIRAHSCASALMPSMESQVCQCSETSIAQSTVLLILSGCVQKTGLPMQLHLREVLHSLSAGIGLIRCISSRLYIYRLEAGGIMLGPGPLCWNCAACPKICNKCLADAAHP